MNRGSKRRSERQSDCSSRFNEAPIHESGKSQVAEFLGVEDEASMRPRFMNRGSPLLLYRLGGRVHGFNEAPIHESGKCVGVHHSSSAPGVLQ